MSSSKHIDVICAVVLVLTLIVTVLFMNGEKLGIKPVTNGDEENGYFTANDLNADWDTTNATEIVLIGDGGSVKGDGAYIIDGDVHIAYAGTDVLSGELTDGSIIVEANANDKIWILLNGVTLYCNDSAAIFVQEAGKVFLTLASSTENTISTGAEYSNDATAIGIDGVIYSKDDLTINGNGSLRVTAEYKHGIVCNDDLVIVGANLEISAPQDGIHANDSARFADVDLTISAGDDGITVSNDEETSYIYIDSGNITILECYEGIESVDVTIAGGVINITSTDDGINAKGRGSNSVIRITGGDITILNPTGRDADGLDSNGDIYISGGSLFISVNGNGTNSAIDYGSENGGIFEINGGTVIAAGSSAMLEAPASSSQQGFIMYNSATAANETNVTLKNSAGTELLSETIPYGFSSVIISTPELKVGDTCTLMIGDTQTEITIDNSSDSNGFGMGGFGGGQMPNGGMPGGGGFGANGQGGGKWQDNNQGQGGSFGGMQNGNGQEMPSFGYGNGSGDVTNEYSPQGDIPSVSDDQQQNMPEIPSGGFGGGQMPNGGMPGGGGFGGQMPDGGMPDGGGFGGQIPDGEIPDGGFGGQMPDGEIPGGGFGGGQMQNGEIPSGDMPNGEIPGGDMPSGELPEIPGGDEQETPSGEAQRPEQGDRQEGMGGNRGDRDKMQFGQNDREPGVASNLSTNVSPNTFILIALSALLLLAGIIIALKVRH